MLASLCAVRSCLVRLFHLQIDISSCPKTSDLMAKAKENDLPTKNKPLCVAVLQHAASGATPTPPEPGPELTSAESTLPTNTDSARFWVEVDTFPVANVQHSNDAHAGVVAGVVSPSPSPSPSPTSVPQALKWSDVVNVAVDHSLVSQTHSMRVDDLRWLASDMTSRPNVTAPQDDVYDYLDGAIESGSLATGSRSKAEKTKDRLLQFKLGAATTATTTPITLPSVEAALSAATAVVSFLAVTCDDPPDPAACLRVEDAIVAALVLGGLPAEKGLRFNMRADVQLRVSVLLGHKFALSGADLSSAHSRLGMRLKGPNAFPHSVLRRILLTSHAALLSDLATCYATRCFAVFPNPAASSPLPPVALLAVSALLFGDVVVSLNEVEQVAVELCAASSDEVTRGSMANRLKVLRAIRTLIDVGVLVPRTPTSPTSTTTQVRVEDKLARRWMLDAPYDPDRLRGDLVVNHGQSQVLQRLSSLTVITQLVTLPDFLKLLVGLCAVVLKVLDIDDLARVSESQLATVMITKPVATAARAAVLATQPHGQTRKDSDLKNVDSEAVQSLDFLVRLRLLTIMSEGGRGKSTIWSLSPLVLTVLSTQLSQPQKPLVTAVLQAVLGHLKLDQPEMVDVAQRRITTLDTSLRGMAAGGVRLDVQCKGTHGEAEEDVARRIGTVNIPGSYFVGKLEHDAEVVSEAEAAGSHVFGYVLRRLVEDGAVGNDTSLTTLGYIMTRCLTATSTTRRPTMPREKKNGEKVDPVVIKTLEATESLILELNKVLSDVSVTPSASTPLSTYASDRYKPQLRLFLGLETSNAYLLDQLCRLYRVSRPETVRRTLSCVVCVVDVVDVVKLVVCGRCCGLFSLTFCSLLVCPCCYLIHVWL